MDLRTTKLELIRKIADIQSEKLLEEVRDFLNQSLQKELKSKPTAFSKEESELILKINEGLPEEMQIRYKELLKKSVDKSLTSEEENELLQIIPKVEEKSVERLKYIAELAQFWKTSIDDVMDRLGIKPPPVIHA